MTTPEALRLAFDGMTADERKAWAEQLRKGAQNAVNAAFALQGNLPEAQPDPTTWAFSWLTVAFDQIEAARASLQPPHKITNRKEYQNGKLSIAHGQPRAARLHGRG